LKSAMMNSGCGRIRAGFANAALAIVTKFRRLRLRSPYWVAGR
jgi:hypothetical protein